MNNHYKKKIIILSILLILLPIFIQRSFNSEMVRFNEDINEKKLKISDTYSDILIDDSPGSPNNWVWATSQPWYGGGLGTPEEPYIIENHTFIYTSGGGECLSIQHSRKDFIVRYCNISNSQTFSAGLILSNVTNAQILNNNIFNNGLGIVLDYVNDSIVSNNKIYNSKISNGIFAQYSHSNTISGNYVFNNTEWGIDLKNCNYNTISGNQIYNNTKDGIWIELSDINIIMENTVYNNSENGILIDKSDSNEISRNIVYNNSVNGIFLKTSDFNNLSKNELNYNTESGIYLEQSQNNTIQENDAYHNKLYGLYLYTSNSNNVSGNTANNNGNYGLHIEESDHNNIIDNLADENKQIGVYLYFDCNDNRIANNNVNNNTMYGGIIFDTNCNNNSIIGNSLIKNFCGIILDGCDFNNITRNIINNNTWGIYIESGSNNNSLYENFLLKNGNHANDWGTDNKWNSTTIGNYWDNWTSPDSNHDGIVDDPYTYIDGIADSIDHLPIAEDGAPQITINSPNSGDIYSLSAPSFEVEITDIYVFERWYTMDGGVNNYAFTENGMINQSAWDAIADGSITLEFYASDIIYQYFHNSTHMGSAEVNIIKDTVAPTIIINSPSEGDKFGRMVPLFNITVYDDNLDAMWYSFDGGLTTFAITNNTVLNQTAWTALAQGEVTITFYASDLAGNEASESVTVIKSVPSGGLEPGVIITIFIVSIVGGAAVVAGVYIFMKKRAAPE